MVKLCCSFSVERLSNISVILVLSIIWSSVSQQSDHWHFPDIYIFLRWRFGADLSELNSTKPWREWRDCWPLLRVYSMNSGLPLPGHRALLLLPWICISISRNGDIWFHQLARMRVHTHSEIHWHACSLIHTHSPRHTRTNTSHTHTHTEAYSHYHTHPQYSHKTLTHSDTLIYCHTHALTHTITRTNWYTHTHTHTHTHPDLHLPAHLQVPDEVPSCCPALSWCPSTYTLSQQLSREPHTQLTATHLTIRLLRTEAVFFI